MVEKKMAGEEVKLTEEYIDSLEKKVTELTIKNQE